MPGDSIGLALGNAHARAKEEELKGVRFRLPPQENGSLARRSGGI